MTSQSSERPCSAAKATIGGASFSSCRSSPGAPRHPPRALPLRRQCGCAPPTSQCPVAHRRRQAEPSRHQAAERSCRLLPPRATKLRQSGAQFGMDGLQLLLNRLEILACACGARGEGSAERPQLHAFLHTSRAGSAHARLRIILSRRGPVGLAGSYGAVRSRRRRWRLALGRSTPTRRLSASAGARGTA